MTYFNHSTRENLHNSFIPNNDLTYNDNDTWGQLFRRAISEANSGVMSELEDTLLPPNQHMLRGYQVWERQPFTPHAPRVIRLFELVLDVHPIDKRLG